MASDDNDPADVDQVTLEARAYGVARSFDPFLVNSVVGFIGPEYLFDERQIVRQLNSQDDAIALKFTR